MLLLGADVSPHGQKDKHNEANGRFSNFLKASKNISRSSYHNSTYIIWNTFANRLQTLPSID
jgi:hypothetical protein